MFTRSHRFRPVLALFLAVLPLLLTACQSNSGSSVIPENPRRVITMAPALTETVYALGLSDLLVGRSRYCVYPEEAQALPETGGLFDPNYERILRLEPDLIIGYPEHEAVRDRLRDSGIPFLVLKKRTLDQIATSFIELADTLGHRERGVALAEEFNSSLKHLSSSVDNLPEPSVMISVGRTTGENSIREIYAAGNTSYFAQLVELAGGRYAYQGPVEFPVLSSEAIIRLNPDVIIEISVDIDPAASEEHLAIWDTLEDVHAVQNDAVHLITAQYAVVPGPRLPRLLERFIAIIHGGGSEAGNE